MLRIALVLFALLLGVERLVVDEDDAADDAAGSLDIALDLGVAAVIFARLPGEEVQVGSRR